MLCHLFASLNIHSPMIAPIAYVQPLPRLGTRSCALANFEKLDARLLGASASDSQRCALRRGAPLNSALFDSELALCDSAVASSTFAKVSCL